MFASLPNDLWRATYAHFLQEELPRTLADYAAILDGDRTQLREAWDRAYSRTEDWITNERWLP
jgi:hypothetical protein